MDVRWSQGESGRDWQRLAAFVSVRRVTQNAIEKFGIFEMEKLGLPRLRLNVRLG